MKVPDDDPEDDDDVKAYRARMVSTMGAYRGRLELMPRPPRPNRPTFLATWIAVNWDIDVRILRKRYKEISDEEKGDGVIWVAHMLEQAKGFTDEIQQEAKE